MDKDNGVEEASTSNTGASDKQYQNEKKSQTQAQIQAQQNDSATNRVPFYKLFSFADSTDKALMIIGTIGAIGNGVCMPLMAVIFGELVDSFGENQNTKRIVHIVSQVPVSLSL